MPDEKVDGMTDVHESIVEAREELAAERAESVQDDVVAAEAPAVVESAPEPVAEPVARPVPQFSPEGVLLNPQDCEIGADGVVKGKS